MKKRIFSMLTAICMIFSMIPMPALAESSSIADNTVNNEKSSICENHIEHDGDCGGLGTEVDKFCAHACDLCEPIQGKIQPVAPSIMAAPNAAALPKDSIFTADITVGGNLVACTFKVLADNTVQIGNGTISSINSNIGARSLFPKQ